MFDNWAEFNLGGAPFLNALKVRERRIHLKAQRKAFSRERLAKMIADLDGPTVYDQLMKEWSVAREENSREEARTEAKGTARDRKAGSKKARGGKPKSRQTS